MTRAVIKGIVGAVVAGLVMAAEPAPFAAAEPLPLTAKAVPLDPGDPARTVVGRLRYLGGLELRSADPRFGGVSGLRAGRDGWFLGLTDTGAWVTFRTVERRGRLTGVRGGVIAPILDDHGQPATSKIAGDSEGLEWPTDAQGGAAVFFEQDHRAQSYASIDPARPETLNQKALRTDRYPETADWPANGGGEAYAKVAPGTMLVLGELAMVAGGGREALLLAGPTHVRFTYQPPDRFNPTDAIALDAAQVLVLNRHFSPLDGAAAALTLIDIAGPLAEVRAGKTGTPPLRIEGAVLATLAPPLTVDNMEGMALVRDGSRTFLYLVSDDNFNPLQRTLLMKFELLPLSAARRATSAAPRPASPPG